MLFLYTFLSVEIVNFVCHPKQMFVVKLELLKVKVKCLMVLHVLLAKDNLCTILWVVLPFPNTQWSLIFHYAR